MGKIKRILAVALTITMVFSLMACGGDGKKQKGKVKVSFWAEVNSANQDTLLQIVEDFNNSHSDIYVTLVPQSAGYASGLSNTLRGSNPPDVVTVDDKVFKSYVEEGYLEKLDDYIKSDDNENFSFEDIWPSSVNRFSYNFETGYSGTGADYYAIPAGNNPTIIYYNVDLFEEQNVNIISVPEDELGGNFLAHGYYVYDVAPMDGMVARQDGKYHVFNNRIPMNWEELIELSKIFTESYNASSSSTYGFVNEWWFSHGWSVGGDCLEWSEEDGQYIFNLGDETPNYLVTGKDGVTINGTEYAEGETLSYADKKYVVANMSDSTISGYINSQNLYELPSIMDAFTEFTRMSQTTNRVVTSDTYGYGISPSPTTMDNNSKASYFTTGEVAMVCEALSVAYGIGQTMDTLGKKWDVAPLYQYREYNADGSPKTVNGTKVFGNESGHSYIQGYAIPANAKNKEAAWEFISYIAGLDGEKHLMKTNLTVPNQMSLANSEVYLKETSNYAPTNKAAIVDMAAIATVGDWSYVEDGEWINDWANVLNTKVRDGDMTLDEFFKDPAVLNTNEVLKKYDAKKYND